MILILYEHGAMMSATNPSSIPNYKSFFHKWEKETNFNPAYFCFVVSLFGIIDIILQQMYFFSRNRGIVLQMFCIFANGAQGISVLSHMVNNEYSIRISFVHHNNETNLRR